MNRQDGHLQFDTKRNNLRSYAHGQLCHEQCSGGSLKEWMKNKSSTSFARAMQGFRLTVESMTFTTTLVLLLREAAGGILKKETR
jgi:hypothetical protein